MKAKKSVLDIDSYVPGKSKEDLIKEFNISENEIIKLGSNENPWGPSDKAVQAVQAAAKIINRYPESDLTKLEKSISEYAGVEAEEVIVDAFLS